MIVHFTRDELADFPVYATTLCGKALQVSDSSAEARRVFANQAVKVLPVLDGARYVGAVNREMVAMTPSTDMPVGALATHLLPTATAMTPTRDALATLDAHGGSRLVVLGDDGATYVGLVCLRGDRRRLCLDSDRIGV